jgi:hypothetical protein
MRCEAPIGNADQFVVEGPLACAFFISTDKHDGAPLSVECEREAPKSIQLKPELFHVRKG